MKKTLADLLKTVSLLALAFFIAITFYLNLPFVFLKNKTCIYIHSKENFKEFIADITQNTRYVSPFMLKAYAKLSRFDRHLEAGEYCFTHYDTIDSMTRKIKSGKRERHKFTIVDGWTYQEVINHLTVSPSLSDTYVLNDRKAVAAALKLPENKLEGALYPLTYYYAYPDTAVNVLEQAHVLMEQRIQTLYQEPQARVLYKSAYELLIAASIIEKESNNAEDQKFVASVLINRLKLHMKLQMDPTVIYGLGENYISPLKKKDLGYDSLYNTYLYMGLPPTPICMPGETALYAAAHPNNSKYLYYVSKKNGYHQFSETLAEQTIAIQEYLLSQKSKN